MKCIRIIQQDEDKTISCVEDETTHILYIQKVLNYYDIHLYQTLQELKDPHIPKIYDIQEKDNQLILLEEYVNGKTLEGQIFDEKEVKIIFHQLCQTLNTLHHLNPPIIHRDIKPENIIYHNQNVTLIDFDIARFQDKNKFKDTQVLGSVGYAAPEQFGFQQSSAQSDIYSLGKLLNVLLNGQLEVDDTISYSMRKVIHKACQMDAKNRYKDVLDMDRAIQGKNWYIPGIHDETIKKKIIRWIWILLIFGIAKEMEGSTNTEFNHMISLQISGFFVLYTILFVHDNKINIKQYAIFRKIPWCILFPIFYLLIVFLEIIILILLDSFL